MLMKLFFQLKSFENDFDTTTFDALKKNSKNEVRNH